MRAERLLTILHLLQAHTQLTARDLARRLDVSTRTVTESVRGMEEHSRIQPCSLSSLLSAKADTLASISTSPSSSIALHDPH